MAYAITIPDNLLVPLVKRVDKIYNKHLCIKTTPPNISTTESANIKEYKSFKILEECIFTDTCEIVNICEIFEEEMKKLGNGEKQELYIIDPTEITKDIKEKVIKKISEKIDTKEIVVLHTNNNTNENNDFIYHSSFKRLLSDVQVKIWLEKLFKLGAVISGGMSSALLSGKDEYSDIDIFLIDSELNSESYEINLENSQYKNVLEDILSKQYIWNNNYQITITKYSINIEFSDAKIQIIRTIYKDMESVVNNFDIANCQVCILGNKFYATKLAIIACAANCVIPISKVANWRYAKYLERNICSIVWNPITIDLGNIIMKDHHNMFSYRSNIHNSKYMIWGDNDISIIDTNSLYYESKKSINPIDPLGYYHYDYYWYVNGNTDSIIKHEDSYRKAANFLKSEYWRNMELHYKTYTDNEIPVSETLIKNNNYFKTSNKGNINKDGRIIITTCNCKQECNLLNEQSL